MGEIKEELKEKLEKWREALEKEGLKVSRKKTGRNVSGLMDKGSGRFSVKHNKLTI